MNYYESPVKSFYEILTDFQVELEANHMAGSGLLEITVTPLVFSKIKLELCDPKHLTKMGGDTVFRGDYQQIQDFKNWTDNEIHLPYGKVIVRCK